MTTALTGAEEEMRYLADPDLFREILPDLIQNGFTTEWKLVQSIPYVTAAAECKLADVDRWDGCIGVVKGRIKRYALTKYFDLTDWCRRVDKTAKALSAAEAKLDGDVRLGDAKMEAMNACYAFIQQRSDIYDLIDRCSLPLLAFCKLGPDQRAWWGPEGDLLRNTYYQLTFEPDETNLCTRGPKLLNLFRPDVIVQPTPPGETRATYPQTDLIDKVIRNMVGGDEKSATYVWQWLAFTVRNPTRKCCALLVRGVTGTGKGTIGELQVAVFGGVTGQGGYACVADTLTMQSKWTGWLHKVLFCWCDEPGAEFFDDKKAIANSFKRLITEQRMILEEKGMPMYEVNNYTRSYITSNARDAMHIERGDRRYSVFSSSTKLDKDLGIALRAAVKDPAFLRAYVDLLQDVDLTDFEPFQPFENAARDEIIDAGMTCAERFWADADLVPPPGTYPTCLIYRVFERFCTSEKEPRTPNVQKFSQARPENVLSDLKKVAKEKWKGTSVAPYIAGEDRQLRALTMPDDGLPDAPGRMDAWIDRHFKLTIGQKANDHLTLH